MMTDGASIQSTSALSNAGSITVVGTARSGGAGVVIDGAGTRTFINSVNGNMSITGNHRLLQPAAASGSFRDGVVLWRLGQIESTGSAKITISGTAGKVSMSIEESLSPELVRTSVR